MDFFSFRKENDQKMCENFKNLVSPKMRKKPQLLSKSIRL